MAYFDDLLKDARHLAARGGKNIESTGEPYRRRTSRAKGAYASPEANCRVEYVLAPQANQAASWISMVSRFPRA